MKHLDYKTICKIYHNKTMKPKDRKYLYSDIDETLLIWPVNPMIPQPGHIGIEFHGTTYYLKPHEHNINTLKSYKDLGYTVVLWSLGGEAWAKLACKALGLKKHVKYCLAKPNLIIDDLEPIEWMPENLYQKEDDSND